MPPRDALTIERLLATHRERRPVILDRLAEFEAIGRAGDDRQFLEELAFCIFAAGTSARHGMACVERVRPLVMTAGREQLRDALLGQRFYNLRSGFLYRTREHLRAACNLRLAEHLRELPGFHARRDFLALTSDIAGIGMKEASHFLRNVGYRGYAILDKHVVRALHELGVVASPDRPSGPARYREIEGALVRFAEEVGIDPDELDLVLWSERTGVILK